MWSQEAEDVFGWLHLPWMVYSFLIEDFVLATGSVDFADEVSG